MHLTEGITLVILYFLNPNKVPEYEISSTRINPPTLTKSNSLFFVDSCAICGVQVPRVRHGIPPIIGFLCIHNLVPYVNRAPNWVHIIEVSHYLGSLMQLGPS